MSIRPRRLGPLVCVGFALALVLLYGYWAAVTRAFGQVTPDGGSLEVQGSATAGQTFIAPFDGLYRVDVFMSPGNRSGTGDVLFHLRTGPDAIEDLRSSVMNASTIKQDDWGRFAFSPIPDSGGKTYYLLLESPSSKPGGALSAFRSAQDRYRDGSIYLDGGPSRGDLAFLSYSRPGLVSWLRGLCRLLAQDKPSVWGTPALYGLLFAGYLILLVAALRLLRGKDMDSPTA